MNLRPWTVYYRKDEDDYVASVWTATKTAAREAICSSENIEASAVYTVVPGEHVK